LAAFQPSRAESDLSSLRIVGVVLSSVGRADVPAALPACEGRDGACAGGGEAAAID